MYLEFAFWEAPKVVNVMVMGNDGEMISGSEPMASHDEIRAQIKEFQEDDRYRVTELEPDDMSKERYKIEEIVPEEKKD